ncbi:hypothetical protein [Paenibacillus sp. GYB003]|uniref:hypothetical protein n=1 Tax=Paenibacillus sp. GYB003 TaxID=2994392 RepID=UPI002F96C8F9
MKQSYSHAPLRQAAADDGGRDAFLDGGCQIAEDVVFARLCSLKTIQDLLLSRRRDIRLQSLVITVLMNSALYLKIGEILPY